MARSPSVLNYETVVGLGTEIYDPAGFSMDWVYLHMAKWTDTDEHFENRASKRDPAWPPLQAALWQRQQLT